MKTLERNNVKIDYTRTGKGNTTLLFVHGAFINKDYWDAQVNYFKPNFEVVTIDLPGHGKSGRNRDTWTIQEFGKDLIFVIEKLNLRNVILIGHSMGGDIILEAAANNSLPVIGFVGVDNFKNAASELPEEIQNQVDEILERLRTDFANTSEAYAKQVLITPATDNAVASRVLKDYRDADPLMGVQSIASAFTYYKRERELMQQLKLKMFLINVDYMPSNEEPLKKYAGAGYEILPIHGTSHYPMIENPDEFNHLLEDVITKITRKLEVRSL